MPDVPYNSHRKHCSHDIDNYGRVLFYVWYLCQLMVEGGAGARQRIGRCRLGLDKIADSIWSWPNIDVRPE